MGGEGIKKGPFAKSSKKVSNSCGTLNNKTMIALLSVLPVLRGSGAKTLVVKFKTSGCLTSSDKRINAKVGEMVAQRLSVGQHMFKTCFCAILHLIGPEQSCNSSCLRSSFFQIYCKTLMKCAHLTTLKPVICE